MRGTLEARFWAKVDKSGTAEHPFCSIWTGSKTKHGYGKFWDGKKVRLAHHVAYEMLIEPIPPGLVADHICRNPSCIDPGHIEPVTQRENVRRGHRDPVVARRNLDIHHAKQRARTHCKHGHPLDRTTVRAKTGVRRYCLTCQGESQRKYRAGLKERNK